MLPHASFPPSRHLSELCHCRGQQSGNQAGRTERQAGETRRIVPSLIGQQRDTRGPYLHPVPTAVASASGFSNLKTPHPSTLTSTSNCPPELQLPHLTTKMEYKRTPPSPPNLQPRLILHGGAGNITPFNLPPSRYAKFRTALLTIVTTLPPFPISNQTNPPQQVSKTHTFMTTPQPHSNLLPSALSTAVHAVTLLEENPLFNASRGAVFTRDGLNELEASVMVTRGHAKRAVGVSGLRRVRNPILLAREVLERGDEDLVRPRRVTTEGLDVPSAQGHTHIHGAAAEELARGYGLEMVEEGYFWTERRWREHVAGLEREREGRGVAGWSAEEFVPQGTVGAVAVDVEGVVCVATSTGGLTNKLTGRVGDTPTVGAGFWAEEWIEKGEMSAGWRRGPAVDLTGALRALIAECFPTPWMYAPAPGGGVGPLVTTRSVAVSGTGNGDSFLRTAAARTVGSIARFAEDSSAGALSKVTGPGGELQQSAGDRWGKTGEGEGGMIGIECVVVRDAEGSVVGTQTELLQDYNCGGMFRAWVDEKGAAFARVFREGEDMLDSYVGEGWPEDVRVWSGEKLGKRCGAV